MNHNYEQTNYIDKNYNDKDMIIKDDYEFNNNMRIDEIEKKIINEDKEEIIYLNS